MTVTQYQSCDYYRVLLGSDRYQSSKLNPLLFQILITTRIRFETLSLLVGVVGPSAISDVVPDQC